MELGRTTRTGLDRGVPRYRLCAVCCVLMLCLLGLPARGQDIHFSQIDANPMLFNPAYCGFIDGTGRFGIIYRNQWQSVGEPYQTFAATAEVALVRNRKHRSGFSMGVVFDSDRAGALSYGLTTFDGILSFYKAVGQHSSTLLSAAVSAGAGQAGFLSQNASMMDPAEDLGRTETSFFTLGTGVALYHQFRNEFDLKAGAAVLNLNRPDISYLGVEDAVIYPRAAAFVRGEYRFYDGFSLLPILALQHQHTYNELVYGLDAKWYISESSSLPVAFSAGVLSRHRDALMISLALEYGPCVFSFSYDANLSYLATASHTIGAYELGIVYRLADVHGRRKNISCPVF